MKFLCDNCKAKYQIADEKVAGKTVRMKCRKCGHSIEVRAAVTESSVAAAAAALHVEGDSVPPRPAPRGNLATSLSATKPRPSMTPQAPTASPGTALGGAFQRSVGEPPANRSFTQPAGSPLGVSDDWYVAVGGIPVGPVRMTDLRQKAATGAVTEDSLCWQEGLEEWRPIRSIPELAEVVREAAKGDRTSVAAPPLGAPDYAAAKTSLPPRAPQRPAPGPVPPRGPFAAATASPRGADANAPQGPAPSTALPRPFTTAAAPAGLAPTAGIERSATPPAPVVTADPFAVAPFAPAALAPPPAFAQAAPHLVPPAPVPVGGPSPGAAAAGPAAASVDPFAPSPPSPAARLSMAPAAFFSKRPRSQGTPLWFWPILVFAAVFAVSAAVLLFRAPEAPPPPVAIQVPATSAPTATPVAPEVKAEATAGTPAASAEPAATTSATNAKVPGAATAAKSAGATNPSTTAEKKGVDMSGLLGGGAGGPNLTGGAGGAGGGGGLDSASVERVVASHRSGVKRTCWERGGADQKSSVNVTISATVAPDGSVANTSSSGDDPVVAKCIESQVRTWRFNAPGSSTTVNIPFKFVRQ